MAQTAAPARPARTGTTSRRAPAATTARAGHIHGLDGLRALAVGAVLVYHLRPTSLPGGFLGVDVFFVISGFLITTLLLRELGKKGRVDLPRFWLRRARRLLPALVSVVVVSVSLAAVAGGDLLVNIGRQVLGALTFSNNWLEIGAGSSYFAQTSPLLFVNFWSLAVEEQFYLLWPPLLGLLLALTSTGRQRVRVALAVAAVSALLMALLHTPGQDATRVYYGTDTHLFGLMIGVALAFAWASPHSWLHSAAWQRWRQPAALVALAGLLVLMTVLHEDTALTFRGGILAASLLTAVLVAALLGPVGIYQRLLRMPPVAWLGERSYGIYLWHWPLILVLTELMPATTYDSALSWTTRALALVLTLVVAGASYRWLEMPVRQEGFLGVWRRWSSALRGGRRAAQVVGGAAVVLLVTTAVAVATAPTTSLTQQQIEANEELVAASAAESEAPEPLPADADWTVPAGEEISGFGDSIMVTSAHGLTARWPEIALDAKSNRQWPDGLAAVEQAVDQGTVRRAVVLDFGTNAGVGEPDVVRAALDALGPGRMVVVVNLYGGSYWIPEANAALADVVADYPNAIIADWYAAIDAEPEKLQSDGIHPDIEGGHLYTDVVAEAFAELSERLLAETAGE
ncbi:acyltransferase family protein [Oceanitalea stevensii]|uniref:Acyltransferase n=1 Tax=Oceanitalea stevensii TaxID=2763072 RepID=A0ABR8Z0G4_9MICO|nr:acyltransferase family protein [Oceanitalea stevensii]MBD8061528.1 acyltransferase [Oceanitalea stevensii]